MINDVRNTVLSILNKNNYGYISPSDFNLFSKQAQLYLFDQYIYKYNRQIVKENARMSGTGNADVAQTYQEILDNFSRTDDLTQDTDNEYFLPSETTTGFDAYKITRVDVYADGTYTGRAELINQDMAQTLSTSMITSPSKTFPAYTIAGSKITMYPSTINGASDVKCNYLRFPKDPKWTYVSLANGEPAFDQSASDYQDFELPLDCYNDLVYKILEMAGMSIREADTVNYANAEEQQKKIEEQ